LAREVYITGANQMGPVMTQAALSPELQLYQQSVLARRASSQIDFPAHVHLETLALCNAACNFCPYPTLDRKGERMDDALIAKVVDDLADIPRLHAFQLSPFKVNEPFLDVRLFDLLAIFNERLPNASLTLTTNATPLTEKKLAQLAGVKNLGYLWVSVNDYREVEYEAAMQLPFKRTLERLAMLHAAKADGRLPTRVVLSRVGDGGEHDAAFRGWVARTFPLFESSIFVRGAWIGQVDGPAAAPPDIGCQRWFDISITATGVVAHCCMDGKAEFPIGDVRHEHVLDIYNKPEYRRLRERTSSRLDVEPCRGCGFL
jgi:MoaA/NifB/PqqE/SkfB family radical SAM enzyme